MNLIQKQPFVFLLGILALGFLLYYPSLDFEFLPNFDDDKLIYESEANQGLNADKLKALFTESVFGLYHPITSLTWAIEHELYGFNPKWFHLSNILWHLLNTVLVFFLSRHFLKRNDWSLWVSLLFVIHPMHTENIVWLSARKDLVYGFFFLLGLLSYLRFQEKSSPLMYASMLVFFIASLFSKSNAVVFPAVLILLDMYQSKDFQFKYILNKIPLFVLSLLFIYITISTQEEAGFINSFSGDYSIVDRIFMGFYSLGHYLFHLLFPFDLNPKNLYPNKEDDLLPWVYYASPILVIGAAYIIYRLGKKEKLVWLGAGIFLVIILPVLKLIPTGNDIVSNRYAYLPFLGLYIGLSYWLFQRAPKWIVGLLAVWVIGLGATSYQYQNNYENSFQLWTKIIESNEGNNWGKAMALNERGQIQMKLGNNQAAARDIQEALELDPTLARGLMNRAVLYDKSGNVQAAFNDLNVLIETHGKTADALKLRGVIYGKMNQIDASINDFSEAITLSDNNPELYNNRGIANSIKGSNEEALKDFKTAIELSPNNQDYRINRGKLLEQMGQFESATKDFLWAYEKAPKKLKVAYPLAKVYFKNNQKQEAKKVLKPFEANQQKASELAQRLSQDSLFKESIPFYGIALGDASIRDKTLYQRAQSYRAIGEKQNAADDLLAILENLPNPQIFFEIGSLYWELENLERACEFWQEAAIREHQEAIAMNKKHCF